MVDRNSFDIIGVLMVEVDSPEGAEARPGWHVNTLESQMAARPDLEAFRVNPANPKCRWHGDDGAEPWTVFLWFESEAAMLAVLPELAPPPPPEED